MLHLLGDTMDLTGPRPETALALLAPGFLIFYAIFAALAVSTGIFLVIRSRKLTAEKDAYERDPQQKAESWKYRHAAIVGNVEQEEAEKQLGGVKVVQRGFQRHWTGQVLYTAWIVFTASLQILFLGLVLAHFNEANERYKWISNGLFNLNICTADMLDNVDASTGYATANVPFCTLKNGPTTGGYSFNNIGAVFILFWLYSLAALWFLLGEKFSTSIQLGFYLPCCLVNADYVIVEEWTPNKKGRRLEKARRSSTRTSLSAPSFSAASTGNFGDAEMGGDAHAVIDLMAEKEFYRAKLVDWRTIEGGLKKDRYPSGKRSSQSNPQLGTITPQKAAPQMRRISEESIDSNISRKEDHVGDEGDSSYLGTQTIKKGMSMSEPGSENKMEQPSITKILGEAENHMEANSRSWQFGVNRSKVSLVDLETHFYREESENKDLLSQETKTARYFCFQCAWYIWSDIEGRFVEPADEYLGKWSTGELQQAYKNFWQKKVLTVEERIEQEEEGVDFASSNGGSRRGSIESQSSNEGGTRPRKVVKPPTGIPTAQNGSAEANGDDQRTETIYKNSLALSRKKYEIFGKNVIEVEVPGFFKYVQDEFFDFVTMLQFQALWSPTIFTNYMLAILSGGMFVIFGMLNAYNARRNQQKLQDMAKAKSSETVLCYYYDSEGAGGFITKRTRVMDLVPGDIIEITNGMSIPADCAVLYGNVVVNESNLTGEAMPIQKFPIEVDSNPYLDLKRHGKKNVLYSGTTVMQSTSPHADYANALVLATGSATTKGHMIREILFAPKKERPNTKSWFLTDHDRCKYGVL